MDQRTRFGKQTVIRRVSNGSTSTTPPRTSSPFYAAHPTRAARSSASVTSPLCRKKVIALNFSAKAITTSSSTPTPKSTAATTPSPSTTPQSISHRLPLFGSRPAHPQRKQYTKKQKKHKRKNSQEFDQIVRILCSIIYLCRL